MSTQQSNKLKPTTAQLWLMHTLETLFFGAIVTGSIGVYQSIGTGNYDVTSLLGIFLPAFVAVLSKGWSSSIANNANLGQAISDSISEVKSLLAQSLANAPQSPSAPLVVVHAVAPPQVETLASSVATVPTNTPLAQQAPPTPQYVAQQPFPTLPPATFAQSQQMPVVQVLQQ